MIKMQLAVDDSFTDSNVLSSLCTTQAGVYRRRKQYVILIITLPPPAAPPPQPKWTMQKVAILFIARRMRASG